MPPLSKHTGHQFGRGVDQPDYSFSSGVSPLGRAIGHAPVTRRAIPYGFDPQLVSIEPRGGTPPVPIRTHFGDPWGGGTVP